MIAFHLIFISFFVAITCTDSHPLAFFAEIDGNYLPLSYTSEEIKGMNLSVLSFSKAWEAPVEFKLQDKCAFKKDTSSPGALGFFQGLVGFGPDIVKEQLKFDQTSRVLNHHYYLCRVKKNHLYELTYGNDHRKANFCFRAQLYLLPYDKQTMNVIEQGPQKRKHISKKMKHIYREMESYKDLTFGDKAHFVEKGSPNSSKPSGLGGNSKYDYAEKNGGDSKNGYGGDSKYGYGGENEGDLKYGFEEENGGEVVKILDSEKDIPRVFHAKVDGTMIPLSGHIFSEFRTDRSTLSYVYGDKQNPPVKFFLEDDYAITKETSTPGYVGIVDKGLFFGPNNTKTKLNLDESMRVRTYNYFSCPSVDGMLHVITTSDEYDYCFQVEIYLLPFESGHGETSKYKYDLVKETSE